VGGPLQEAEIELRCHAESLRTRVDDAFEALAVHEAAAAIGEFVTVANRYLQTTAPWTLAKRSETERLAVVLEHALEAARLAAWYYEPFIPRAAREAQQRLTSVPPSVGKPLFPRLGRRPKTSAELCVSLPPS
jgi:methionyl-tRNA synthetase